MHVHYQVAVDSLAGHLFAVKQSILQPEQSSYRLSLPAWIPGSYMIRDFAKNIVRIHAYDDNGDALGLHKLDKQSWQVDAGSGNIYIEMQVYAYDWSVRSAYINEEYAFFNGTSLFLAVEGYTQGCSLEVLIPAQKRPQWQLATAMQRADEVGETGRFVASDYQELIDHPVIMGDLDINEFEVQGIPFEFVLAGSHRADSQRICNDLAVLCDHHLTLFGKDIDLHKYVFITLLSHAGFGGLEHRSSTVLQYARDELPGLQQTTMSDGYRAYLSLCSHEFLHTWHVKRNKPDNFIALDLSREVYTEQLWIYEGFTSYIDDLSLVRSDVIDAQSYLQLLGQTLTRLARNPGNTKQTVTESSFDAWTRFYQQDASAANNIVSYYTKGSEIALCLDLLIRQKSDGQQSLFTLMQLLWQHYGQQHKGTPKDVIQQLLNTQLKINLDDFLQRALYTTEPLPTAELLAQVGVKVHYRARTSAKDKGGTNEKNTSKVAFGATYQAAPMGVKLTQVLEASPAYQANLHVGDLLLAIDHWQVTADNLTQYLDQASASEVVSLHIIRDNRLIEKHLRVQPAPLDTVYLEILSPQQTTTWLSA